MISDPPPFSSLDFFFGLRNQNFKEKLKQTYCRLTSKCIIKLTHNWCSSSLKAIHNLCNWIHVWNFSNFIIKRWFAEESRTPVLNQSPGKKGNLYNINTCRKLIWLCYLDHTVPNIVLIFILMNARFCVGLILWRLF